MTAGEKEWNRAVRLLKVGNTHLGCYNQAACQWSMSGPGTAMELRMENSMTQPLGSRRENGVRAKAREVVAIPLTLCLFLA